MVMLELLMPQISRAFFGLDSVFRLRAYSFLMLPDLWFSAVKQNICGG